MSYSKSSKRANELLKIRHRLCERPSEERRRIVRQRERERASESESERSITYKERERERELESVCEREED